MLTPAWLCHLLGITSASAASGALCPSTGASFSPTRVISWRSKIPTSKTWAHDRGRCVAMVGFYWFLFRWVTDGIIRREMLNIDAFRWRQSELLPSHTAWGPRQPCSSPAPRGWSACNRPPARFCACEGPRASPPRSLRPLRDPDGVEAHGWRGRRRYIKNQRKAKNKAETSVSVWFKTMALTGGNQR